MSTIIEKVKTGIDIPRWQQLSPALNAHAAGVCWATDKRNSVFSFDAALWFNSNDVADKISKIHLQGHTSTTMYRSEAII